MLACSEVMEANIHLSGKSLTSQSYSLSFRGLSVIEMQMKESVHHFYMERNQIGFTDMSLLKLSFLCQIKLNLVKIS